jgi:hypothetical protein
MILVAGATGLLGFDICLRLRSRGLAVRGLAPQVATDGKDDLEAMEEAIDALGRGPEVKENDSSTVVLQSDRFAGTVFQCKLRRSLPFPCRLKGGTGPVTSILGRSLRVIDDENFHRPLGRCELQPELFL